MLDKQDEISNFDQFIKAMAVFKRHMKPVESVSESDEQMTTQEILDKFQELMGVDMIDYKQMYDLLTAHGFIYDYVIDGFKWLIKTAE